MNVRKQLGKNLKAIRKKKGLSQEALSDASGLHRTYISGIERGVRNPTVEILQKIAQALNVTPAALLYRADEK